ncbi:MAG: hypothetical protein HC873_14350 [Leptolyngbyaceae cyanobacterium SL_1_1]|nr:hypothetical protein [Leptolyngbyaceae cyanobacterium SL_1_1]
MADRLMGDVFSDMLSPPGSDVESDTESDTEVKNLTPQIAATASAFPLQISLDQTTYLVRARQPLLLQIQICSEQRLYAELPESELTLVLRNPQTSELLATLKRSLLSQSLPAQIEVEAKLPAAVKTYLILGELTLQSLDEPLILAAQAFTVAAMLDELIETVADQGEYLQDPTQWHLPLEGTAAQVADAMGQVVRKTMPVQLPSSVRPDKPAFLPSTGMFLPPQIHNSLLAPPSASNRSPVLPSLPPITQADSSLSTAASDTAAAIDIAAPEADLPLTAAPEAALSPDENRSEPALAAPPEALTVDQADEDADFIAATQQNDFEAKTFLELKIADTATAPLEDSEVDVAFQSLNLKDRFWSRLSAFALDGYKAAQEIQAATELGEMIANQAETAVPNETIAPIMSLGEKDFSREFVVYDAAAQTVQLEDQPPPESRAAADAAVELPPVPIPKLKVPVGTLIAGELISIEVTLRATPERLCVKFWTSDLQTRALVDNPRWLMSFDPDGQGNMSTTLRLTVPQGCLEARFARSQLTLLVKEKANGW